MFTRVFPPRNLIVIGALLLTLSTAVQAASLDERKEKIRALESSTAIEALERKARSEAVLREQHVPINPSLPVIETAQEARQRTREEVAYRAMALLVVAVKGEGLEQPRVDQIIRDYGLQAYFSPQERAFLKDSHPSEQKRAQFSWRYEAAWSLLWALGYVDTLQAPAHACDAGLATRFMQQRSAAQFIKEARLRPLSELLDQTDRIYRYHWAVVDARVEGQDPPKGVDPDVTMERHYALNWLVGYMDQDWDDVSTDT